MPFGSGIGGLCLIILDSVGVAFYHACGSEEGQTAVEGGLKGIGDKVRAIGVCNGVVVPYTITNGRGAETVALHGTADAT